MESRGNYLVRPIAELGSGAFGRVEKIELYNTDGHLCGEYARKVLSVKDELIGSLFSYDDWRRRFEREVKYQAECLSSHVVPVCIHHLSTENPWFVMELAESDLRTALVRGQLSDSDKIQVILMILEGVNYVHSKGYLHRDLKPENILKFKDGRFKISDFGLVKNTNVEAQSEVLTKIAVKMGTDGYMAPEAQKGIYTEKTDIYAIGAIIHEINVGNIDGIDAMIGKATTFRPIDRYAHVQQMITDLRKIIQRRMA